MDIGELLADGGVVLRSGASSKRQALHVVADAAAQALGMPEQRVLEALLEREALGSTGLGAGVAVPHARLEGVERVTAGVLPLCGIRSDSLMIRPSASGIDKPSR